MTLAKPLAGGLPIGVCMVKDHVAAVVRPGDHGGTFGGNPLAASVALSVLERIADPDFLEGVREKGAHMHSLLSRWASTSSAVAEIRGPPTPSLWAGVQLTGPVASKVIERGLESGVLFISAGPSVIRLSPALTASKDEITHGIEALKACVDAEDEPVRG